MSLDRYGFAGLRQSLGWSNSWPSWQERLILLAFLAVAAGLGYFTYHIGQTAAGPGAVLVAVLAWAGFFVAVVVSSWFGWLKLFGPVLFYDMVRTARRSRYVFMRLLYASVLLAILCVMYFTASDMGMGQDINQRNAAVLAEIFFSTFMIVQLVLVVLLTPAYVSGAIAEEKDRKTLEFMLATDLGNQEIVLSKLLSRLANMTLFLLTGLPILSILQFLGGVDSHLMLAGFAATGLTMLGIASVGILFSTLFKRPRDAIGLTYLSLIAYMGLATLGKSLSVAAAPLMSYTILAWEGAPAWVPEWTWHDASYLLNTGNPIGAMVDVALAFERGTLIADLPGFLRDYAWFHAVVAVVCVAWSIARLRAIALAQTPSGTTQKLKPWERIRPAIGELPMLWKEVYIEGSVKLNWLARGVLVLLVLLTIGSGVVIVGAFFWELSRGTAPLWWEFAEAMNVWFRVAGTGVATLLILVVGVRASSSIASERERDTFDALITTPLSAESILAAKVLGSLLSLRIGWLWFGCMIAIGTLSGGLHILAAPIFIGAWFIYATFFTMVGTWFSMVCKSSLRATVYTVLTTLFLGGGHWIVMGFFCYLPAALMSRGGPGTFFEVMLKFQAGMTPPFVLGLFAYSPRNLASDFNQWNDWKHLMLFSLFGFVIWSAGCAVMWYGLLLPKFNEISRREEGIYQ